MFRAPIDVFSMKQIKPPFELFLLRNESRAENLIDERVELPQLVDRHRLKLLPVHDPPESRFVHSLGSRAGGRQVRAGWAREKSVSDASWSTGSVFGMLIGPASTDAGATRPALLDFAGRPIRQSDFQELQGVGAE